MYGSVPKFSGEATPIGDCVLPSEIRAREVTPDTRHSTSPSELESLRKPGSASRMGTMSFEDPGASST